MMQSSILMHFFFFFDRHMHEDVFSFKKSLSPGANINNVPSLNNILFFFLKGVPHFICRMSQQIERDVQEQKRHNKNTIQTVLH